MFLYNINEKIGNIFITIPDKIKYNSKFLDSVAELMEKTVNSECNEIFLSCKSSNIDFNKMGVAYLYNTLLFWQKRKQYM